MGWSSIKYMLSHQKSNFLLHMIQPTNVLQCIKQQSLYAHHIFLNLILSALVLYFKQFLITFHFMYCSRKKKKLKKLTGNKTFTF